MAETKLKIIKAAERLFFDNGVANVRLQQVANEVGISVGNLAYHFRNKEAIVSAVFQALFEELSDILSAYLVYPNLADFDKQFGDLYAFMAENPFYINNIWEIERTYPGLKKQWTELNLKTNIQLEKRIAYNVKRGVFRPADYPEEYSLLANALFVNINFWISQQMLMGNRQDVFLYKRTLWSMLYPYLTPKGKMEFEELIRPIIYAS